MKYATLCNEHDCATIVTKKPVVSRNRQNEAIIPSIGDLRKLLYAALDILDSSRCLK